MCSIIGASAPNGVNIDKADLKLLYLMAEERGGHACGFTNGKKIIKTAETSYTFVNKHLKSEEFPENVGTFIGHTRYATIGNKTDDDNAHPFAKHPYIGVHNGSIYNHDDLKKLVDSDATVDSEILYECIAKFGLKKVLPLLQGLLALSFFDLRNKAIYLYRIRRPLSIGYKVIDGAQVMFWASEGEFLEAIDCTDVKEIPIHTIYKVKNGRIIEAKNLKKDLEPKEPTIVHRNNVRSYSKVPSLHIFEEEQEHLKKLNLPNFDELTTPKEEVKEERSCPINPINENRQISRYMVLELNDVPMNAVCLESKDLGYLFYWFDPQEPHHVHIYSVNLGCSETYDMLLKDDIAMLTKQFANDDSDIVQGIKYQYALLLDSYEKRMELEEDEKENVASHE